MKYLCLITSVTTQLRFWIKPFEFTSGNGDIELPINRLCGGISVLLPGGELGSGEVNIQDSAIQTLSGHGIQLHFGDIEPATMFGRVVYFQSLGEPKRNFWRECQTSFDGAWHERPLGSGNLSSLSNMTNFFAFLLNLMDIDKHIGMPLFNCPQENSHPADFAVFVNGFS